MLRIKQPWTLRGPDESRKSLLSLDKGHLPQVLAIKPQKVEGVRDWFPFSAAQLVEPAHALRIDADNLAVRKLLYHDPRTSAVSSPDPWADARQQHNVRGAGLGTASGHRSRKGPHLQAPTISVAVSPVKMRSIAADVKNRLGILAALTILFCSRCSPACAPRSYTFSIAITDNMIFLDAKVNGHPVQLLVDTGATQSVFEAALKPEGKKADHFSVTTASKAQDAVIVNSKIELKSLNDGEISLTGPAIYGRFQFPATRLGIKMSGVLGMDVLGKYRSVNFDFQRNTLSLSDK